MFGTLAFSNDNDPDMKTITTAELQQILATQPSAPLIDVRTPAEFAEVHIPQARSIPLDELNPGALSLPKDQPVYLVCRTDRRSAMAAEQFAANGYTQPIVVVGGTLAWFRANLPVTRGDQG